MLLPIPIGYFVSLLLIISGVLNCVEYLAQRPEGANAAVLLNGFVEAGWPVIAASVILLLIQVNRQLEKLRLESVHDMAAEPAVKQPKKKPAAAEPAATPQQPMHPQVPRPVQPAMRQPAGTPAQKQMYPNSPIPGGGRVPHAVAPIPATTVAPVAAAAKPAAMPTPSTPLPPRPEPVPATRGGTMRTPDAEEAGKLSFFKVD